MARFHRSTNTPTKAELVEPWLRRQTWAGASGPFELGDACHLEDPGGEVGMQLFDARLGTDRLAVALSYRAEPLPGAEHACLGEMTHSVLGRRVVYDAVHDPAYLTALAGVAAAGYGQALGFVGGQSDGHDDGWWVVPEPIVLVGGGSIGRPVRVDGFEVDADGAEVRATNGELTLTVQRRLTPGPLAALGVGLGLHGVDAPLPYATLSVAG